MESRRHVTTADLAGRGEEVRGRGDEQATARSARDAAETFMRSDVGASGSTNAVPGPALRDSRETSNVMGPAPAAQQHDRSGHPPREGEAGSTSPMLFPHDEAGHFRTEWTEIQAGFVDSPRQAVERADALIASVMQRLASTFARERATLEQQWDRGGDVTTEDLRVVLQRYRSFFDRLLSA
jgi:hypothetical protein